MTMMSISDTMESKRRRGGKREGQEKDKWQSCLPIELNIYKTKFNKGQLEKKPERKQLKNNIPSLWTTEGPQNNCKHVPCPLYIGNHYIVFFKL